MVYKVKSKKVNHKTHAIPVQEYLLEPRFDGRKSFYGKARVVHNHQEGKFTLISYSTKVAEIKNGKAYVYGLYSNTTTRHIKEFLRQHGFKADSSGQIIKDYGVS